MSHPVDPPDVTGPDDLYSLPLERFIEARDRLAATLVDEGSGEAASAVSKLRKPSVAAWGLNQAARSHREEVQRLVTSHDELRKATSAETLRQASDRRRRAVAELEAAAVAELAGDGRPVSATTRSRITNTLLAIATDIEGEKDFVAGRLVREIEPSGAGWGDIGIAFSPERSDDDRAIAEAKRARDRAEKLRKQAESAEHGVELALRALEDARRRADVAAAQAELAEAEAARAEETAGLPKPS